MRKFLADTVALIVFSTVGGAATEILIAGMTVAQSAQARITAIPLILLTARPYGFYRDWLFRLTGSEHSNQLRKTVIDIAAFVSFQVPVYVVILLMVGASLSQIVAACSTAVAIMIISGRLYGLFLELCRRAFGVTLNSN